MGRFSLVIVRQAVVDRGLVGVCGAEETELIGRHLARQEIGNGPAGNVLGTAEVSHDDEESRDASAVRGSPVGREVECGAEDGGIDDAAKRERITMLVPETTLIVDLMDRRG
jgi:hypothetical protein